MPAVKDAPKPPAPPTPATHPWLYPPAGLFTQEQLDFIVAVIDARLRWHIAND